MLQGNGLLIMISGVGYMKATLNTATGGSTITSSPSTFAWNFLLALETFSCSLAVPVLSKTE